MIQPGYCLKVAGNGTWERLAGKATLQNGTLAAGWSSAAPHVLRVSAAGQSITAALDGTTLAVVQDGTYASGSASVATGWHAAALDHIALS